MHGYEFLQDLLFVFGIGLGLVVLFHRFNLPAVLAFLVTGILCGPYGLTLVDDVHNIETLAEIGIVLLLFTLGIEFSVPHFIKMRRFLLIGGALQVGLTIVASVSIAHFLGIALPLAVFIGMLLSISSTALVLRLLDTRNELNSAHGRNALTILIFQDLCIVPMVLLIPFLGGQEVVTSELLLLGGKSAVFVVASVIVVKFILPWVLDQVAQTRKREAFILAIVFLCLGTAWATAFVGLSMALGAFAAGLVLSESKFSHQALGEVVPFREVFNCLVFVSIGMLFDVRTLAEMPVLIAACVAVVIVGKSLIAGAVTKFFGHSLKVSILTGLALGQTSEFSFVLGKVGLEAGVIDPATNQLFLSVAILSMMLSPAATAAGPKIVEGVELLLTPFNRWRTGTGSTNAKVDEELKDHAIIVGFDYIGKRLAKALDTANVPYIVIHDEPMIVREEILKGRSIIYGDATNEEVLRHARIGSARMVALTLHDYGTTKQAADLIKRLNPSAHILARGGGVMDSASLIRVGADEVVSSRVVTSIDFVRRVLDRFHVPGHDADDYVLEAMAEYAHYSRHILERFHSPLHPEPFNLVTTTIRVEQNSQVAGKSLADIDLPGTIGANITAIQSASGETNRMPGDDSVLETDDVVMILGRKDEINEAALLFRSRPEEEEKEEVDAKEGESMD